MVRLRSARRPFPRRELRPNLEALEGRFCLNGASSAIHHLSLAHETIKARANSTGNSSGNYSYVRVGKPSASGLMMGSGSGGVALEGGGTDVDAAFQWMIQQMNGTGDFLVLTAVKNTGYNSYIFNMGGTNSVATLEIPSRSAAMNPAVASIITSANAVFIAGGAQNDYINYWQGTPVQAAIATDIANKVPVGGTSAGTDVFGQFIYSAEATGNGVTSSAALANPFNKQMTFAEDFVSGSSPSVLPYLNNTLIDTHFVTEDRLGRMTAFLGRVDSAPLNYSPNKMPMGIGINEQTALLIDSSGNATVVGNANATSPPQVDFFETTGVPQTCVANEPLTYSPIYEETVLPNQSFNLANNWTSKSSGWAAYASTQVTINVNSGVLTTQPG